MGPCIGSIFQYISNKMQRYTIYIWKLLYMFRVILPPIIRSAYNCIYRIWYLSHRYCYLPLSWKRWNRFECAVGGICHPQHTQTGFGHEIVGRELQTECILDKIDEYRRNWLLHLQRMPPNRIPFKSYHYRPQGRRTIGRPKKRWREQL